MENLDIEAIRERCNKLASGPWSVVTMWSAGETRRWVYGIFPAENADRPVFNADASLTEDDANFIASARQDIPALLDEIVRLRSELDACRSLNASQQEP